MDNLKEVLVVSCVDLCEDVICSRCEMAVYHFGNLAKAFNDLVELGGIAQYEPYVSASLVTDRGWVNLGLEAFDYT